jgi:glycine/D-amino acid oxidase-like deaminating enzyme
VDVAILGGGFTGLWTAWSLLREDPSLEIAVVERDFVGFGASGRNGAWCSPHVGIGMPGLVRRFGVEEAARILDALHRAVSGIGEAIDEERINAGYHRVPKLLVATGPEQLPSLRRLSAAYEAVGAGDAHRLLDAAGLAERVRIAGAAGALEGDVCATLHPGRLVAGLADAVERRGGTIYEGTTAVGFRPRGRAGAGAYDTRPDHAELLTDRGPLRADAVLLAGEAYLTRLPALRRRLIPLYSHIVLTEPLDPAVWERIGWDRRECVASLRLTVEYLARTEDGRILFGGRGAPYGFASAIRRGREDHAATHARLRAAARDWFPPLADATFTHAWGGVIGVPRDGLPTVGWNPRTGLGIAAGYAGTGVSMSYLAGRTLTDLVLGRSTARTRLPWVNDPLGPWPPEPLRWLGVRTAERTAAALDEIGARWGRRPPGRRALEWLLRS